MAKKTTGYRLHAKRLQFTGGEAVRTIKYPLTTDNPENLTKTVSAIIHDSLRTRGPLNLNDYLENRNVYTLVDFWMDSLRAGVIWAPKTNKLIDVISSKYIGTPPTLQVWQEAKEELHHYFEAKPFIEKVLSAQSFRRGKTTKPALLKRLIGMLKEEHLVKTSNIPTGPAQELLHEIVNAIFPEDDIAPINQEAQTTFWKERFGLDKSRLNILSTNHIQGISFYIAPELIDLDNADIVELINNRSLWVQQLDDIETKELLGLTPQFPAFSNYFNEVLRELQNADSEHKIRDTLFAVRKPTDTVDISRIEKAITFLIEKAQQLPQPKLANSWADYRTNFGGKLSSWYENYTNRLEKLDGQISILRDGLQEVFDDLTKLQNSSEIIYPQERLAELLSLHSRLQELLQDYNITKHDLLLNLLGTFKSRFNEFWQRYMQTSEAFKKTDKHGNLIEQVNKAYKKLYTNLYKPIEFFGESKEKENKKIVESTIQTLTTGIPLFRQFITNATTKTSIPTDTNAEVEHKSFLEALWQKYSTNSINNRQYKSLLAETLRGSSGADIWTKISKDPKRYQFLKNKRSHRNSTEITVDVSNAKNAIVDILRKLDSFQSQFLVNDLLSTPDLLLDYIEIEKLLLGKIFRFLPDEHTLDFTQVSDKLHTFKQAGNYVREFGIKEAPKHEARYILNSLIFPELRGAATRLSKKIYIAKYTIQPIQANNKFPLIFVGAQQFTEHNRPLGKTLLTQPHSWRLLIPLTQGAIKKTKSATDTIQVQKDKLVHIKPIPPNDEKWSTFNITSSKYQIQFLEKILDRANEWSDMYSPKLGEWSLIVGKQFDINWNLGTGKPTLQEKECQTKLFVSIPFNIRPIVAKESSMIEKIRDNIVDYPFLGIDVGEYGVGWVLAKFADNSAEILSSGFIEDKNIKNIQDQYEKLQQQARTGIFNETNTKIARIRENAIGRLRNQIHKILTDNNATVTYEASISNFETGSGRVSKIYKSVKTSDTAPSNEADKAVHNHIWGGKSKYPGTQYTAYASSYTCSKCGHSVFELGLDNLPATITWRQTKNTKESLIKIRTIDDKELMGYTTRAEHQEGFVFQPNDNNLKELRKVIKAFVRPSLLDKQEKHLSTTLAWTRANVNPNLNRESLREFKRKRGNSSVLHARSKDATMYLTQIYKRPSSWRYVDTSTNEKTIKTTLKESTHSRPLVLLYSNILLPYR